MVEYSQQCLAAFRPSANRFYHCPTYNCDVTVAGDAALFSITMTLLSMFRSAFRLSGMFGGSLEKAGVCALFCRCGSAVVREWWIVRSCTNMCIFVFDLI